MDYEGEKKILSSRPIIIEGSYALHPSFPHYWDKAIFLDVEKEEQLKRLEKRCPEKLEAFKNKWIPLEEEYFSYYSIPSKEFINVSSLSSESSTVEAPKNRVL